jgi:hypothetical protein
MPDNDRGSTQLHVDPRAGRVGTCFSFFARFAREPSRNPLASARRANAERSVFVTR